MPYQVDKCKKKKLPSVIWPVQSKINKKDLYFFKVKCIALNPVSVQHCQANLAVIRFYISVGGCRRSPGSEYVFLWQTAFIHVKN